MLVNLVYSPFVFPNVPVGIAVLKSALTAAGHSVKCIDLNLVAHQYYAELLVKEGRSRVVRIDDKTRGLFGEANEFFSSKDPSFFEQRWYNRHGNVFISAWSTIYQAAAEYTTSCLASGTTPVLVEDWVDRILENQPDAVGFSVLFLRQFEQSLAIARCIKARSPSTTIIFGGGFFNRVDALSTNNPLVSDMLNGAADYVISHEGQEPLVQLLSALDKEKPVSELLDLCYFAGGRLVGSGVEPSPCAGSDEVLNTDYEDFDLGAYYYPEPALFVSSSSGCFWRKCTFCSLPMAHTATYRSRPVGQVVDELEFHHKTSGARFFYFIDESVAPKRFNRIGSEIQRRGLQIYYTVRARPGGDFTADILNTMYESGCRLIMWGVESGSQTVLDTMGKGTRVEEISAVLKDARHAGIRNHVYLMPGFPTETAHDSVQTVDFLYHHRDYIEYIHSGPFRSIQGTPVHLEPERFGVRNTGDVPNSNTCGYCSTKGLDSSGVERYHGFLKAKYFNHFSRFSNHLGKLRIHALMVYANSDKIIWDCEYLGDAAQKLAEFQRSYSRMAPGLFAGA